MRLIRCNSVTDGTVRMVEDMIRSPAVVLSAGVLNFNHIPEGVIMKNQKQTAQKTKFPVRMLTVTALLAALSYLLAFLEIPVPLSPSFARFDLSDFPALIAAFTYGPIAGFAIELIKNALQLITTSTAGVGEFANFVIGACFVVSAGLIYRHRKTTKNAWIACILSSFIMGVAAAVMNYFVLLPMFEQFMPLDEVIASFGAYIPFIQTKLDVVLYNAFPFNLLKGLVIGIVTVLIYKKLTPFLKGRQEI